MIGIGVNSLNKAKVSGSGWQKQEKTDRKNPAIFHK
jgi:hypothetical protein